MCWWGSNGKKQSPNPYQVQLFLVPWTTLPNNPDLQRKRTYNHTRHHSLSALWWREQRFPFSRLNNRPCLQSTAVMWIRAQVWGNGFRVSPRAALWKPFHGGEGFENKKRKEKTQGSLWDHIHLLLCNLRASANISQNRQIHIHPYLSSFICMKTEWKRCFSVI